YTHNRLATCHLSSLSSHYLRPPPRSPLFPYTTLFRSTQVLNQQDMPEFDMHKLPLYFVTLTNYDDTFQGIKVVYDKENLTKTLGEVLENHNKKQIRIAETEKYPHVTFFFSGGREVPFEGESRILCPSPKVATYDLKPEMS